VRVYAWWLFGIAAALNLSVSAGLLLMRSWLAPFLGLDPIVGTNLVLLYLVAAFIAVFGYIYIRIAIDPVRFREFVHVSAVGKLLAVLSSLVPWMSGAIPATLPMLFGGDLILALLFFEYLRRSQRETG